MLFQFIVPAFAQQDINNVLPKLRTDAKLKTPDDILADFVNGKPETAVIVILRQSAEGKALADRSRAKGHVPVEFMRPGAPEYYDLRDESIRNQLKATVTESHGRVINNIGASGMKVTQRFSYQFGFAASVTPAALQRILALPEVISVEKDVVIQAHLAQGIPLMNAATVRSSFTGAGLSIAICDTGIDTSHPVLGGGGFPNAKVIGGYDTGDNDADPTPGSAGEAHGTACASIAAGSTASVGDYIGGVAPDAKLYAVKISTGTSGSAATSAMIAGWEWCITHQNDDPAHPILIISTSFGGGQYTSTCDSASTGMTTAAANAVAAGITIFASSGNDGFCDSIAWPACISYVNSVGAVYDANFGTYLPCISQSSCAPTKKATTGCSSKWYATDSTAPDKVTSYSNSASFLTLFAPSNQAYTADIVGAGGYSTGDYDTSFGGTSAACPYAAGSAAVLQQAAKASRGSYLTPSEVRAYLVNNGDNVTDTKVAVTKPRINLGRSVTATFPAVQFALASSSGSETVTPAQMAVNLSFASGQTVTVNYATADGTATSGSDYTATSGTLTFAPGVTTQTIDVPIIDDASLEPGETFTVTLSSPVNATLGAVVTHTYTIINHAFPPAAFSKTSPVSGAAGQAVNATTLGWGAASGAASYEYCYDTTNDNACSGSWTSAGAGTSAIISGLNPLTTYFWQVRALNSAGATEADSGGWWSFTTAEAISIIKGPYLQNVTPNSVVVMWETSAASDSRVDYGMGSVSELSVTDPTLKTIHEVTLSGLQARTLYLYKVTSAGTASAVNSFPTAPATADTPFRFVAYGDTRTDTVAHSQVAASIIPHDPDFVLHVGDLVANGRTYSEWEPQFFTPAANMLKNTPMFSVLGNHEYSGTGAIYYFDFFSLPNNEKWYAFTYGSARFIALNACDGCDSFAPGSAQYNWLVSELQSTAFSSASWQFVWMHNPPYTAQERDGATDADIRTYLVPLFEQYGVDVVFGGDDHQYRHSLRNGIHYIVTGGGGAPLHDLGTPMPYAALIYAEKNYEHCVVDVTLDSINFFASRIDGTTMDSFSLSRPTDISISGASIDENLPTGSTAGVLSTTDPNTGDTFTYTLVSGTGSADNGSFSISGNALVSAASFNFEAKNSYSIRVRSTDQGGLWTEKAFTISVTDVNEPPTTANSSVNTVQNIDRIFVAADFPFSDVDAGNTLRTVRVQTLPAAGTLYVDRNGNGLADTGEAVAAGGDVAAADIAAGLFKFKPGVNGYGTPYTTFTFKVGDGQLYSAGQGTMTINVADVTPPSTTPSVLAGTYPTPQSITLTCNDGSGIGCDKTYYCLGAGCTPAAVLDPASPISIASTTDLRYYSIDKAGNGETVRTTAYKICGFVISPTSIAMPANPDLGSIGITVPAGCGWTASTQDSWITITTGTSGSGSGPVKFSVKANSAAAERVGHITVTGLAPADVTITQSRQPLQASFVGTVNNTSYENPFGPPTLDVTFDASGSKGPSPITGYSWNFGDGITGSGQTAAKSYAATGSYIVTLTVTDGTQTDTTQRIVTVADQVTNVTTSAQLQSALTTARNNGKHDLIRMAGGTYNLSANGNAHFTYTAAAGENKDLVLEGGWTTDFGMRAYNIPTILRNDLVVAASTDGGVLSLDGSANATTGDIAIDGLTITGGNTTGKGGGLYARAGGSIIVSNSSLSNNSGNSGGAYLESTSRDVWINGNRLNSNSGGADVGAAAVTAAGFAYVYTNEVTGNTATAYGGLRVQTGNGGEMVISNNTITGNTGTTSGGGLAVNNLGSASSVIDIHNNIIISNSGGADLVVTPGCSALIGNINLGLMSNDMGTYSICADYPVDPGNRNVLPYFIANSTGDIKLRTSDTQLIDTGINFNTPVEDIEGDPIPSNGGAGPIADIGADEFNQATPDTAASMNITPATPSITNASGSVVLTITLNRPAKRDTVLYVAHADTNTITPGQPLVTVPQFIKVLKGATSAQATVQAVADPGAGASSITVTDPSGKIAQATVAVTIGIVPVASVAPAAIDFGGQLLNTSSVPRTVTVTNTGTALLSITGISIGGTNPFQFSQNNNCGGSLAAGTNCTVNVTFKPTWVNSVPMKATLDVTAASPASSKAVALGGAVDVMSYSVTPASISFHSLLNVQSTAQTVTLTNTGTTTLPIGSIDLGGTNPLQFGRTNNCGGSLAAGASCTVNVTFKPTWLNTVPMKATLNVNAGGTTTTTSLTGTIDVIDYIVTPASLSFHSTMNAQSPAQTITVTNTGTAALPVGSIELGGTNPLQFGRTNNCAGNLAVGSSCTVNVTFKPTWLNTVPMKATLIVNAGGMTKTASLTGTIDNVSYTVTPASLAFSSPLFVQSAAQTVTVTNTGTVSLSITGIEIAGTNLLQFSRSNNCPAMLAAGAGCTVNVTFRPTWLNTVPMKATLNINMASPAASGSVALTGTIP